MNVIGKAAAVCAAWSRITGSNPPSRAAVLFPLAQADLETNDGDAWGGLTGPHNWGAVDLRAPNETEHAAIAAGTLKTGYWLHVDGSSSADRRAGDVGQLHVDSHPGGTTYSMWFRAFDSDDDGAASFLRVVFAKVGKLFDDPAPTLAEYVTRLYVGGYFEATHPTQAERAAGMLPARPYGHRTAPFLPAEAANIAAYASGMARCLASLEPALAGWTVPGGATGDLVAGDGGVTTDAQQSGPGPGWEGNDGSAPAT